MTGDLGDLGSGGSGGSIGGTAGIGGIADELALSRAYLSRVAEPACIPMWGLVREHGPVGAAELIRTRAAGEHVNRATEGRWNSCDPAADLEAAERHGIRLVTPESDDWPHFALSCLESAGLAELRRFRAGDTKHADHGEPIPPLALWVRGSLDLAALGLRSVGIVGARSATPYGMQVATDLAFTLAGQGFDVVSGGAYGIDAAAHRGALAAGGTTVVVSAGGIDSPYPPSNRAIFERAAESGLVVSESPPGAAPHRRRFLTRNRLIAALATGSVVVEAAMRSGALNTARHCTRLGRPLMAVPGPVTSTMSAGCHDILRSDERRAVLVGSAADVIDVIGGIGESFATDTPGAAETGRRSSELDDLDPTSRQVYDGFPGRRAVLPDELAVSAGVPVLDVIRTLPLLELTGLIEQTAQGFRRRTQRAGVA